MKPKFIFRRCQRTCRELTLSVKPAFSHEFEESLTTGSGLRTVRTSNGGRMVAIREAMFTIFWHRFSHYSIYLS